MPAPEYGAGEKKTYGEEHTTAADPGARLFVGSGGALSTGGPASLVFRAPRIMQVSEMVTGRRVWTLGFIIVGFMMLATIVAGARRDGRALPRQRRLLRFDWLLALSGLSNYFGVGQHLRRASEVSVRVVNPPE